MYRNPLGILFISLFVVGIGTYTVRTSYHLWQIIRLDKQIAPEEIQWSIVSASDEKYIPFARYRYNVNGTYYKGETLWQDAFLNHSTAQEAISRISSTHPSVWFADSSPEISTLQKKFPLKEIIYTVVLWLLGLYFFGLGYYVTNRS